MNDVLCVHKVDTFADLAQKYRARLFCEHEVVVYHTLEQFSALDPFRTTKKWTTETFLILRATVIFF